MKKISSIIGVGLLGAVFMSFTGAYECDPNVENLKVEDISVIQVEEEIDLGFNTAQYLPVGFNPYKGIKLGFDTAQYLPADFNACEGMETKNCYIDFLKEEEKIMLEFNEEDYLPENSNSQAK